MEPDNERAARYSDLFAGHHEHAPECAYCPICATIAVVRRSNPEVLEHLAGAARELLSAAAKLLEEADKVVGHPEATSDDSSSAEVGKVRRIDVV
jgi:hypothetical protein